MREDFDEIFDLNDDGKLDSVERGAMEDFIINIFAADEEKPDTDFGDDDDSDED